MFSLRCQYVTGAALEKGSWARPTTAAGAPPAAPPAPPQRNKKGIYLVVVSFLSFSQEIIGRAPRHLGLSPPGCRVELRKGLPHVFVDLHDGGHISAPITVIRGRKYGDHVLFMGPIIPLHHQLVGPSHQGQAIGVVEELGDVLAEGIPCRAR
jgi:hypothetical protein